MQDFPAPMKIIVLIIVPGADVTVIEIVNNARQADGRRDHRNFVRRWLLFRLYEDIESITKAESMCTQQQ
jgi:hypothetical protein